MIWKPPLPEEVLAARTIAGISLAQIAEMLGLSRHRVPWDWEAGRRKMIPQTWNMLLLFTNQHPNGRMRGRARIDNL
jgi:DNA-binding transcriptional regulator YiaG